MNGKVCPIAKMETLIVATDGSEFSKNAIREAIKLAKVCSSKLIAVSVMQTNLEFEAGVPQVIEKAEKEAAEHLESIKNMASKEDVECETIVHLSEEPYQDIVYEAKKNHVNLIIIGTHGRTGLKKLMMGSVTAKVIGHAPCKVLVVPLNAKVECRNILVATDGSRYSDAAASEAIDIAKRCGSSLIVLSVASSDAEVREADNNVKKVVALAIKEGIKTEGITLKGKPYETIVQTSKQKEADLIIVGSHGKTGLKRLFMGSVAEGVISHAESVVLVVRVQSSSGNQI